MGDRASHTLVYCQTESVIIQNVSMLKLVMLSVTMLNGIMVHVIMLDGMVLNA